MQDTELKQKTVQSGKLITNQDYLSNKTSKNTLNSNAIIDKRHIQIKKFIGV